MDSHLSNLEENTSLLSNESQVETKSSMNSFFVSKKIAAVFALACLGVLAFATFSSRPIQSGVSTTTLWTKNSGYMCEVTFYPITLKPTEVLALTLSLIGRQIWWGRQAEQSQWYGTCNSIPTELLISYGLYTCVIRRLLRSLPERRKFRCLQECE